MAYIKNVWTTGDIVSAEKLNNMELGIEAASITTASYFPMILNSNFSKKASSDEIKIFVFGSSWFINSWWYLNKITNNLGINATITGYYMGHSQFNEWLAFYNNDLSPFAGSESTRSAYRSVSVNGANYTTQKHVAGGEFGDQEYRDAWYNDLISGDYDIVIFQQGAHQTYKWTYWTNCDKVVTMLKRHCKPNTVIGFNSTWTPAYTSNYIVSDSGNECDKTIEGRNKFQLKNFENAQTLSKITGVNVLSPCGAIMSLMRSDNTLNLFNDDMVSDGLHATNGLPMLGIACALFESTIAPFYNISIDALTWKPDSSTQKCLVNNGTFREVTDEQLATIKEYAKIACSNRFSLSDIL